MGFRDKLRGKMAKHGGAVGLARAAVRRASGSPQSSSTGASALRDALATLPKEPDADGCRAVITTEVLKEGQGNTFNIEGHNVAVFRVDGQLYAIDDSCTHEDGPLGEGALDGSTVACPYHDWRFDLKTGACLTDPDRPVACFVVKEHDGFVWVGARTSEGSHARGGQHNDGLKTTPIEGVKIGGGGA